MTKFTRNACARVRGLRGSIILWFSSISAPHGRSMAQHSVCRTVTIRSAMWPMRENGRMPARDETETLDAMAAAPEHHKILLEDDQVRVLDTCLAPGERTLVHSSAGQFDLRDESGSRLRSARRDGEVHASIHDLGPATGDWRGVVAGTACPASSVEELSAMRPCRARSQSNRSWPDLAVADEFVRQPH